MRIYVSVWLLCFIKYQHKFKISLTMNLILPDFIIYYENECHEPFLVHIGLDFQGSLTVDCYELHFVKQLLHTTYYEYKWNISKNKGKGYELRRPSFTLRKSCTQQISKRYVLHYSDVGVSISSLCVSLVKDINTRIPVFCIRNLFWLTLFENVLQF
jgi:hypothetical protein